MAFYTIGIRVNRICCNNKLVNLSVYDIGDSRTSVSLCANHVTKNIF